MSIEPRQKIQRPRRCRVWRAVAAVVIAGLGMGGSAWLYRLATFPIRELGTFLGHKKAVLSLAFSSSGKLLASAGEDEVIRLWDVSTRDLLGTLKGHHGSVNAVAFIATRLDSRLLVSAGDDRTIRIWHIQAGRPEGVYVREGVFPTLWASSANVLEGHAWPIKALAVSPDGKLLASGGGGFDKNGRNIPGEIVLWDVASGKNAAGWKGTKVSCLPCAFAPTDVWYREATMIRSESGMSRAIGKRQS